MWLPAAKAYVADYEMDHLNEAPTQARIGIELTFCVCYVIELLGGYLKDDSSGDPKPGWAYRAEGGNSGAPKCHVF